MNIKYIFKNIYGICIYMCIWTYITANVDTVVLPVPLLPRTNKDPSLYSMIYIYMYAYVYTRIHKCIYTYIYIYMYLSIYMEIYGHSNLYANVYTVVLPVPLLPRTNNDPSLYSIRNFSSALTSCGISRWLSTSA
jgi:hypothetical protein